MHSMCCGTCPYRRKCVRSRVLACFWHCLWLSVLPLIKFSLRLYIWAMQSCTVCGVPVCVCMSRSTFNWNEICNRSTFYKMKTENWINNSKTISKWNQIKCILYVPSWPTLICTKWTEIAIPQFPIWSTPAFIRFQSKILKSLNWTAQKVKMFDLRQNSMEMCVKS